MMRFTYQYSKRDPKVVITLLGDNTLTEVLEQFEGFLKAAGYGFNGSLDIVEDEETINA